MPSLSPPVLSCPTGLEGRSSPCVDSLRCSFSCTVFVFVPRANFLSILWIFLLAPALAVLRSTLVSYLIPVAMALAFEMQMAR